MPNSKNKNRLLALLGLAGIVLVACSLILLCPKRNDQLPSEDQSESALVETETPQSAETIETPDQVEVTPTLPTKKVLDMSFASQAPFGDWSEPWQNACEEASINIVRYYLSGRTLTKELMRDDILSMVDWQMKNWGSHDDLDAEKTLTLARSIYELEGKVIADYSVDSIKRSIANGVPVIVPTDGRLLNNPNFKNGGPPYHMLVIKGYDSAGFITNDPGTRKGEGYYYLYQTVLGAVKNPDGGPKEVLIITNN